MKRYLPNKSLYRLPFSHKIPWPTQRESSALTLLINFGMAEDVFAQRPRSSSHPMGCPWCHSAAATSLFRKATMVMATKNGGTPQEPENEIFKAVKGIFFTMLISVPVVPRAKSWCLPNPAGSRFREGSLQKSSPCLVVSFSITKCVPLWESPQWVLIRNFMALSQKDLLFQSQGLLSFP